MLGLRADASEMIRLINALPARRLFRRAESFFAYRRLCVRNAAEYRVAVFLHTMQLDTLRTRRFRFVDLACAGSGRVGAF